MACQLQQLTEEIKQLRLYQTPTRKTAPRWSSRNRPPPPHSHVGTVEDRDIFNGTVLTVGQNLGIIKQLSLPHPDSVNTIHSPITVDGYFKDIRTSMLVDTGSALTLVREDLLRACTSSYLLLSRSLNVH